jgi:hypothetical protein
MADELLVEVRDGDIVVTMPGEAALSPPTLHPHADPSPNAT